MFEYFLGRKRHQFRGMTHIYIYIYTYTVCVFMYVCMCIYIYILYVNVKVDLKVDLNYMLTMNKELTNCIESIIVITMNQL